MFLVQTYTQEGKTLAFDDQPFTWQELYAAGEYVIGFIIQAVDGKITQSYARVREGAVSPPTRRQARNNCLVQDQETFAEIW